LHAGLDGASQDRVISALLVPNLDFGTRVSKGARFFASYCVRSYSAPSKLPFDLVNERTPLVREEVFFLPQVHPVVARGDEFKALLHVSVTVADIEQAQNYTITKTANLAKDIRARLAIINPIAVATSR